MQSSWLLSERVCCTLQMQRLQREELEMGYLVRVMEDASHPLQVPLMWDVTETALVVVRPDRGPICRNGRTVRRDAQLRLAAMMHSSTVQSNRKGANKRPG